MKNCNLWYKSQALQVIGEVTGEDFLKEVEFQVNFKTKTEFEWVKRPRETTHSRRNQAHWDQLWEHAMNKEL